MSAVVEPTEVYLRNLVSVAGLVPVLRLAKRAGSTGFVQERGGANPAARPAESATRRLSFDRIAEKALLIEVVQDRARQRYGTDVIKLAGLTAPL
ncbi:hypothetical protein ACFVXE_11270 [Streptomyces sp. NPDC058231]|uniref:hypothetical protein n=1 Tax=Streptomyces sp. NPDC058231 TaxID=3346392 RepID=UPI0036E85D1C